MKNVFFSLSIVFFKLLFALQSEAQTVSKALVKDNKYFATGTYRLTFLPDSTDTKKRTQEYTLMLGKDLSRFQSQSSRRRDSLTNLVGNLPPSLRTQSAIDSYSKQILSLPQSTFRYNIYKFPSKLQLICYDWIGSDFYQYQESGHLFNWIIMPDKLVIANFVCQKAVTTFAGRHYEAWFTREIPVSDGPYKFYGLPGLIIRVGDTHGQYLFELISLTKLATPLPIELPTKKDGITTKAKFIPAQAAYYTGLADRMASMGNDISTEARQKIKRQNPIELR